MTLARRGFLKLFGTSIGIVAAKPFSFVLAQREEIESFNACAEDSRRTSRRIRLRA